MTVTESVDNLQVAGHSPEARSHSELSKVVVRGPWQ